MKISNKELLVGCVIMAAGNSERFGDNKLTTDFKGKPLIRHVLDIVPSEELFRVCVVTQYDEIESLVSDYGFLCVRNPRPEDGISLSIRLGTEALKDCCDAILYMVSDQPMLKHTSVLNLINTYKDHPNNIVGASYNGKRGNPCIFPKKFFPELMKLTGDTGGSSVIRAHEDSLLLCEISEKELMDVDTKEDHFFLEYGVPSNGSENLRSPSSL